MDFKRPYMGIHCIIKHGETSEGNQCFYGVLVHVELENIIYSNLNQNSKCITKIDTLNRYVKLS